MTSKNRIDLVLIRSNLSCKRVVFRHLRVAAGRKDFELPLCSDNLAYFRILYNGRSLQRHFVPLQVGASALRWRSKSSSLAQALAPAVFAFGGAPVPNAALHLRLF